jgi:hypothetical protein
MSYIKNILYFSALVSLLCVFGCDKNKDNQDTWIHLTGYDFPINVSHFADYESTDALGNDLGKVHYGSGGDNNDWKLFEYHHGKGSSIPIGLTGLSIPDNDYPQAISSNAISGNKSYNAKSFDAHGTIYPGIPETITPDSVYLTMPFVFKTPSTEQDSTTPVIDYQVFPGLPYELPSKEVYHYDFGVLLTTASLTDHTQLIVKVPWGDWYALAFYNNQWNAATPYPMDGPADISWDDIPFSDTVSVIFSRSDPFMPPHYDYISTELTEDYHVKITLTTMSGNDVQGFNLLRSESSDINTGAVINDNLIACEQPPYELHTYTYIDENVHLNHTYYYWLEEISTNSQVYYLGPYSAHVIYTNDIPPENKVYPAYPNPCTGWVSIPFSTADSARVSIVILNQANEPVLSWQNYYYSGNHAESFNLGNFPAGLYRAFIWIKMQDKTYYSYGDVLKN